MSASIFNTAESAAIRRRISDFQPDSPRQFGTMTAQQTLCHLADQLRVGLGVKPAEDHSNIFTRTLVKWLIFAGMPMPKGKTKTYTELDQAQKGTPPTNFAQDKQTLLDLYDQTLAAADFVRHPIFGKLNKNEYGKLTYIHFDHHLQQFAL